MARQPPSQYSSFVTFWHEDYPRVFVELAKPKAFPAGLYEAEPQRYK